MNTYLTLPRHSNQAGGIGQYAIDFLSGRLGQPSEVVLQKVEQFHLDSIACGVAALACGLSAPRILREEALRYRAVDGVPVFGSTALVSPEKAVLANCSAVRELDANGTNFGYNPRTGYTRGEFGHNDFYPVAVAAAQLAGWNGRQTLTAMAGLVWDVWQIKRARNAPPAVVKKEPVLYIGDEDARSVSTKNLDLQLRR